MSGSIELTHRCNLHCLHCYVERRTDQEAMREKELGTKRVLSLIDEATDAGCLFLLITGGEPLLRSDFETVYRHARSNGLVVTVFTNATLITESTVALFREIPPHAVEVSLYGATAGTYERITGVKGSFRRCLDGIRMLADSGVYLRLKTVLMSLNIEELAEMQRMAGELGVTFRFDAAISARLDGDKSPLGLRVPAGEAVEREFKDPQRLAALKEFYERTRRNPPSDSLYHCGAGINNFNIDPYGNLTPCIMVSTVKHDVSGGGFMEGWAETIPDIRNRRLNADSPCVQCGKKNICGYCPPFFALENGSEDASSDFICAIGEHRLKAITGSDDI